MSDEIPGCNEAKQCIDCEQNGDCTKFYNLKLLAGQDIIDGVRKVM